MIKLKDILLEAKASSIFIPRRMEDRVERLIKNYIRNGSKGDLSLNDMNLTELPEVLKNVSVSGYFNCGGNELTNLKNSPKYVGGIFTCNDNKLTSLEGAPKIIYGSFYCNDNKLTSLEGSPEKVGGSFYCQYNELTSLTGAPKKVDGMFRCYRNLVKFTEEQVRSVCDVGGYIEV